jgi:hypothetical protein
MLTEIDRLTAIREARPEQSLFAEKEWLISPEPFAIEARLRDKLERLGHQLFVFQRACNQLYQQSIKESSRNGSPAILISGNRPTSLSFRAGRKFETRFPGLSGRTWSWTMRDGQLPKSIPSRAELD